MADQGFSKVNSTTFQATPSSRQVEAVVGDEKQSEFLPRVKLKKWNNEVNFSIGTTQTKGTPKVKGNTISYTTGKETSRFYPITPKKYDFDGSSIRYIKLGGITPERIGSIYELDRHTFWSRQTIVTHHSNVYAMMYYGLYPTDAYLDLSKIDMPEVRISAYPLQNDPMIMDETLKLVDIHYNPQRDDLGKIHSATKAAITTVLTKYGIDITGDYKLYFNHDGRDVKFFSTAFVGGHYYYYVNLGIDYQKAHQYFKAGVVPPTKDVAAYGLRIVNPKIPDTIVDEIITEYAKNYGITLDITEFTNQENSILVGLDEEQKAKDWIREAQRDLFEYTAKGFDDEGDGFEFEIELKAKPMSNIIPLTVQTKGLEFHYQPELTAEESRTNVRPQNVVGSYAAYHSSKTDDKYQAGKAFHIYRPWAVDKKGHKVWCTFDPSWDGKGDLNITVPQDFLDSATYPVTVDPTFGYTTRGASTDSTEGILAISALSTENVLATLSAAVIATNTGKLALYNNGTKVYDSAENTANVGSWLEMPLSGTSISPQAYQLAFWQKAGGYNTLAYDTVTNAGLTSTTAYVAGNNNFPSTATFTANNNKYSIYGTYNTPSYVATIMATSGLQHYYKCNEGTGSTLIDSKGSEHLTISGTNSLTAPGLISGDMSTSFSTQSGTNGIATNTSHTTIVGSDFTYECWVDLSQATAGYLFTEGKDTTNYAGVVVSAVSGTTIRLAFVCRNPTGNVSSSGSAYFDATIPHYVVFRGTRTSNTLEVIIDGGAIVGASLTTYPTGTYSNTGFCIGALWRGSAAAYGKIGIAHVASYNVALSDSTLQQHYYAGKMAMANRGFFSL